MTRTSDPSIRIAGPSTRHSGAVTRLSGAVTRISGPTPESVTRPLGAPRNPRPGGAANRVLNVPARSELSLCGGSPGRQDQARVSTEPAGPLWCPSGEARVALS